MSIEIIVSIGATLMVGFALVTLILLVHSLRRRDTDNLRRDNENWREEFRINQMAFDRRMQRIHDDNTRFFRSMGLTMQQIFERVDRGLGDEPR